MPLPNPQHPWSHIAEDFITDLPESEGNTTVLVVADRFLKGLKLIPLPALPSALEVAELNFHQVFCYYSIPDCMILKLDDIVSDTRDNSKPYIWIPSAI